MFETVPNYNSVRTLSLKDPMMEGEDVFALQHAIKTMGFTIITDGFFGKQTDKLLRDVQRNLFLVVDGKAGPATHQTIALMFAFAECTRLNIPNDAMKGQLEQESGFFLGRYSPPRKDGSFDAGVAQRNSAHTPPREAFKPQPSIQALGENTRKHYDLFAGVSNKRRRWALAQGAWNAPAYACYIAREEGATKVTSGMVKEPGPTARQAIEDYMAKVSQYLTD